VRPHAVVVDIDARRLAMLGLGEDLGAAAPRQELRIEVDAVDELVHPARGVRDEDALPYALHRDPRVTRERKRGGHARARRVESPGTKERWEAMSIVENRKAFHDYFIEERFEAGMALEGWEVKAIRGGRAHLKEAYVVVKNGELVLIGAHIAPLSTASTHVHPDPTRTRRLLMHREEINRLIGKVERAGYTLTPLDLHYSKGRVKLAIGLAKGKKQHDKRATIKEREWNREQQRLLRNRA
jgi:SsrA-binding protein